MVKLRNSFDGGTDGTGMTAGNTGGASGDAFTAVEPTAVFSDAWSHSGALSMKLPSAAVTGYGRWAVTGDRTAAIREYLWMTVAHEGDFFLNRLEVNGANIANVMMNGDNKLRLKVGASSTWTAAATLPLSEAVRLEVMFETGTATGDGRARVAYYLGDSLTPVEDSGWLTGLALAGNTGTITNVRFGKSTAGAYPGVALMDDIALDTGADYTGEFIGPSTAPRLAPAKRWDGTKYVDLDAYRWNGAAYVPLDKS